jgi:hypothetical protein
MNGRLMMPSGCMFDNTAPTILQEQHNDIWLHLAFVNSRVFEYFVRLLTSSRHWQVGYLRAVPFPPISNDIRLKIERLTRESVGIRLKWDSYEETSHRFHHPLAAECSTHLAQNLSILLDEWERKALVICHNAKVIDHILTGAYGLDSHFEEVLDEELESNVVTYIRREIAPSGRDSLPSVDVLMTLTPSTGGSPFLIMSERAKLPLEERHDIRGQVEKLVSYAFGCAFGRWNVECLSLTIRPKNRAFWI